MNLREPGTATASYLWPTFLAGPVIWINHFMLVYLLAEALCRDGGTGVEWFGLPAISAITVVATVVALAAIGVATVRAWRKLGPDKDEPEEPPVARRSGTGRLTGRDHPLLFTGFLLDILSIIAVLFTAAPALVIQPC